MAAQEQPPLRSRRRRRFRIARGILQQQHFPDAIQSRDRFGDDVGEGTAGIELHLGHRSDRIAARKPSAHPGGHQHIADFHILVVGNVRQFQFLEVAGAQRQGANSGTVDLDRQGMVGVGDQNRRGREGIGPDDLADDALLVEYRLADVDAVLAAPIEQDVMAVRIEIHRQQLGDQHPLRRVDRRFQQGAQPTIFRFQGGQLLQLDVEKHLLLAQPGVFFQQGGAAGEILAQPALDIRGQTRQVMQWINRGRQYVAHPVQRVIAMVHRHRDDGQRHPQSKLESCFRVNRDTSIRYARWI